MKNATGGIEIFFFCWDSCSIFKPPMMSSAMPLKIKNTTIVTC